MAFDSVQRCVKRPLSGRRPLTGLIATVYASSVKCPVFDLSFTAPLTALMYIQSLDQVH